MSCAAICSALAETYRVDFAAEILYEMTQLTNPPEDLEPSDSEWRQLIQTFQGVLSTSAFPLVVEHFRKILPENQRQYFNYHIDVNTRVPVNESASATSIARVLNTLREVSWGVIHAVELRGHHFDMAWLVAVCDWILGLRTVVTTMDGSESKLVHKNCPAEADAQVHLIFALTVPDVAAGKELTQIRAFQLTREERHALIEPHEHNRFGRVEWKECLATTFGQGLADLCVHGTTAGTVIGCALRLHGHFLTSRHRSEDKGRSQTRKLEAVYYLTSQLPELLALKDCMSDAASLPKAEALDTFEKQIAALSKACQCPACKCESECRADQWCLVALTETIVFITCLLFDTHIEHGLCPTTVGLESIHEGRISDAATLGFDLAYDGANRATRQTQAAWQTTSSGNANTKDDPSGSFHIDNMFHTLKFPAHPQFCRLAACLSKLDRPTQRLEAICSLFTYYQPDQSPMPPVQSRSKCAIVRHGVCAYLSSLMDIPELESDEPTYRVVSGKIEYKRHSYLMVGSITKKEPQTTEIPDTRLRDWQFELVVTPRDRVLNVLYSATSGDDSFQFDPPHIVQMPKYIVYIDPCPQSKCADEQVWNAQHVSTTMRTVTHDGRSVVFISGDRMELMIQLMQRTYSMEAQEVKNGRHCALYAQRNCCMHCCLRFIANHRRSRTFDRRSLVYVFNVDP